MGGLDILNLATMEAMVGLDYLDGEPDFKNSKLYYQKNKPGQYAPHDHKAWVKFLSRTGFGDVYYLWTKYVLGQEPDHVGRTTKVLTNGYEAGNNYLDYTDRKNR